jgi:hypothetical protein
VPVREARVEGRIGARCVPARSHVGTVCTVGDCALRFLGFVSPNDLAFSGTSAQAKRGARSVRCNALLGV